jgi:molecular chaperone DnaJ
VAAHPTFRRNQQNLEMHLEVKLSEALLGAERVIETLDGPVTLDIPEGVTHGAELRIREKGVPSTGPSHRGKRGDLMVRVLIKLPTKLSKKAKEAVEMLREEGV